MAFVLGTPPGNAEAQSAETPQRVKKVYVEAFGRDYTGGKLRERVIEEMRKRKVEVVEAATELRKDYLRGRSINTTSERSCCLSTTTSRPSAEMSKSRTSKLGSKLVN